ncbi:hypothetical protein GXW78_04735 [Roseomonas terrae]|jgi:hypothetical protein|uniref:DUF1508 domain-containing protein n=1 Tax=Neoroseomonas terrae TaxID=424799 RepID=A0ABS5EE22_9PROT|nr:hypothetical protein [Neoroseomonas terrae]MBR0648957.1 hypothetical protein [Neoroseomonas terrae]
MIEVVQDEETGHFRVVTFRGETLGLTTTRAAANDLAELMLEAWEEAIGAAAARARMKHGAAVIEPR